MMGVDGPRVVVGDQSQVPQAGFVTRFLTTFTSFTCVCHRAKKSVCLSVCPSFCRAVHSQQKECS